jgi:hypothetical protein
VNASRLVIEGCAVATVDPGGSDYGSGHVVVEGNRIVAVGDGPAPRVELLLVNGELGTADEGEISREIAAASRRLAGRAEEVAL